MYNNIFMKNLLQNFEVNIFTLLLAPFRFKLVNFSRHGESLNIRKNSDFDDILIRWLICLFSNKLQRVAVSQIIDRFGRKRCQKKRKDENYKLLRVFSKIFWCTWTDDCQKFVQYIRMLCPGRFILVESVNKKVNSLSVKIWQSSWTQNVECNLIVCYLTNQKAFEKPIKKDKIQIQPK